MSSIPYNFVPEREEARLNPRRRALEDYALHPDVHDILYRFTTDLLQAAPHDPSEYMYRWANAEKRNPNRNGSPLNMELDEKYNLKVDLGGKRNKSPNQRAESPYQRPHSPQQRGQLPNQRDQSSQQRAQSPNQRGQGPNQQQTSRGPPIPRPQSPQRPQQPERRTLAEAYESMVAAGHLSQQQAGSGRTQSPPHPASRGMGIAAIQRPQSPQQPPRRDTPMPPRQMQLPMSKGTPMQRPQSSPQPPNRRT